MMNIDYKKIGICLFAATVSGSLFCGCGDQKRTESLASSELVEETDRIVWAVPDYGIRLEERQELLNQALLEAGYSMQVSFKVLDSEEYDYQTAVSEELKNGTVDLAFMGLSSQTENTPQHIIEQGYVDALSEFLTSEEGAALYEQYTPEEWEASEYKGENYFVPTEAVSRGMYYYAFNRKYFQEDDVRDFSGDLSDLVKMVEESVLENVEYPLIGPMDLELLAAMKGYQVTGPLTVTSLKDYQTYSVMEVPELTEQLKIFYELSTEGFFTSIPEGELLENVLFQKEPDGTYVRQADFGVLVGVSSSGAFNQNCGDVILVKAPFVLRNIINGGTGICKTSDKKTEALKLLELLHTDGNLADTLIYGQEGVDYQMKDGLVVNINEKEEPPYVYMLEVITGAYDHAKKQRTDFLVLNTRQQKQEFINGTCRLESELTGFSPDFSTLQTNQEVLESLEYFCMAPEEEVYTDEKLNIHISKAKSESAEDWMQQVKDVFAQVGGEEMIESLNTQIEQWRKQ